MSTQCKVLKHHRLHPCCRRRHCQFPKVSMMMGCPGMVSATSYAYNAERVWVSGTNQVVKERLLESTGKEVKPPTVSNTVLLVLQRKTYQQLYYKWYLPVPVRHRLVQQLPLLGTNVTSILQVLHQEDRDNKKETPTK